MVVPAHIFLFGNSTNGDNGGHFGEEDMLVEETVAVAMKDLEGQVNDNNNGSNTGKKQQDEQHEEDMDDMEATWCKKEYEDEGDIAQNIDGYKGLNKTKADKTSPKYLNTLHQTSTI